MTNAEILRDLADLVEKGHVFIMAASLDAEIKADSVIDLIGNIYPAKTKKTHENLLIEISSTHGGKMLADLFEKFDDSETECCIL